MTGFNRWTKTWIADYTSVQEIYWAVPGTAVDVTRPAAPAFDSGAATAGNRQLFADYNQDHDITRNSMRACGTGRGAHSHRAPALLVWLPAVRIADMCCVRAPSCCLPTRAGGFDDAGVGSP